MHCSSFALIPDIGEDEWNKLSDQEKQRMIVKIDIRALIQNNIGVIFIVGHMIQDKRENVWYRLSYQEKQTMIVELQRERP